jgi:hypothetical protein
MTKNQTIKTYVDKLYTCCKNQHMDDFVRELLLCMNLK